MFNGYKEDYLSMYNSQCITGNISLSKVAQFVQLLLQDMILRGNWSRVVLKAVGFLCE